MMPYAQALVIAERAKAELAPYCNRIEIAGSVRRMKREPKDIEIVVIPKLQPAGLFGDAIETDLSFCAVVNQWVKVKGEPTGKYTQRRLPEGINLDLFMCEADTWGLQYAIRTGSAGFSHHVLAAGWVKAGYTSIGGRLHRGDQVIAIREEQELFELIGVPWLPPSAREVVTR